MAPHQRITTEEFDAFCTRHGLTDSQFATIAGISILQLNATLEYGLVSRYIDKAIEEAMERIAANPGRYRQQMCVNPLVNWDEGKSLHTQEQFEEHAEQTRNTIMARLKDSSDWLEVSYILEGWRETWTDYFRDFINMDFNRMTGAQLAVLLVDHVQKVPRFLHELDVICSEICTGRAENLPPLTHPEEE